MPLFNYNIFKISQLVSGDSINDIISHIISMKTDLKGINGPKPEAKIKIKKMLEKGVDNISEADIESIEGLISNDLKQKIPNFEKAIENARESISKKLTEKSKQLPAGQQGSKLKDFKLFKFVDKTIRIQVSPIKSDFDSVFNAAKSSGLTVQIEENNILLIKNITKEKYSKFIVNLGEQGWNVNGLSDNALNYPSEASIKEEKTKVVIKITESTNENWDFVISLPNFATITENKSFIKDAFNFSFVGETDNPNLPRTKTQLAQKQFVEGQKFRRCPVNVSNDERQLSEGYYVRGLPSDFTKFAVMIKNYVTEDSMRDYYALIFKYAQKGKFFDARRNVFFKENEVHFDGNIDGFKSETDFQKAAKSIATKYLEGQEFKRGHTKETHPEKFKNLGLYEEQLEGIRFLYSRSNAILGDETGLGKTVQIITAGNLRLNTDSNKTGKKQSGIILTKNAVVQEIISGLASTGIPRNEIMSGDELLEYIERNRLDAKERISETPVPPPWKWAVINYEKFAIPPVDRDRKIRVLNESFQTSSLISRDALNIISNGIEKLYKKDKKSSEDLYRFIETHPTENASVKNKALEFVNNFFTIDQIKNDIEESLMSDGFKSSTPVMSRRDAAKKAEEIVAKTKASSGNYIDIDLSSALRINKKIENYARKEIDRHQNLVNQAINKIKRRENADERQKELVEIINNPNSLITDRMAAQAEWDELEQIRFRFKEGGKRDILTRYLEHVAKAGHISVLTLDEIHTVKNGKPTDQDISDELEHNKNFTTFNLQAVSDNIPNVWGASATVVANTPIDLYNQLKVVNNPLSDVNYDSFVTSVSTRIPGMTSIEGSAKAIRDALIASGVYLQRSKEQIWEKGISKNLLDLLKSKFNISISFDSSRKISEMLRNISSKKSSPEDLVKFLKNNLKIKSSDAQSISSTILQSFNPWWPRQHVNTVEVEEGKYFPVSDRPLGSIESEFNSDFERRMQETLKHHPELAGTRQLLLVAFTHYRFAAAKAKVPYTLAQIKPHIDRGERIGVFTVSDEAGQMLTSGIKKMIAESPLAGKEVLEIKGGQDMEWRSGEVAKFKYSTDKSPYAAVVIQIVAGGTGISLENTAYWSIFNDFPISVSQDEQALGRFYRINTDSDVQVDYMIAPGISQENSFWDNLQNKKRISSLISKYEILDREAIAAGLSANDSIRQAYQKTLNALGKEMQSAQSKTKALQKAVLDKLLASLGSGKKKSSSDILNWYKFAKTK